MSATEHVMAALKRFVVLPGGDTKLTVWERYALQNEVERRVRAHDRLARLARAYNAWDLSEGDDDRHLEEELDAAAAAITEEDCAP